ncbi:hypothetical protein F444_00440 [Phytophthora nicotianae P1976]|uniref:Uncharacterized protein n=1 Tax=Phytophthora nicotianae P1976 TaxID=1317066 RepID=A0A081B498_PHYNI|nr:hypothetical protein F444_00440 [Phytophthora nicotianae P1976]
MQPREDRVKQNETIEAVFLVVYLILISHQLGVSGLHQLAFVLCSQRVFSKVRGVIADDSWFPLEQYGNDVIYKLKELDNHVLPLAENDRTIGEINT